MKLMHPSPSFHEDASLRILLIALVPSSPNNKII